MRLLCSCFLPMCYCTQGRLHFCGYMRGSSQLSSGSSQLSSARALLCVSTLKFPISISFSSMLKLLQRIVEMNNTVGFTHPKLTLNMRVFGACACLGHMIPPTHFGTRQTTDRHIYHVKSRLNTPVWGSLRSPNNPQHRCCAQCSETVKPWLPKQPTCLQLQTASHSVAAEH